MDQNSANQLALWLKANEPKLFAALAVRARMAQQSQGRPLGDWSDIFSSIGDAVGNAGSYIADAAGSVGQYLTSADGIKTLATVGTAYMSSQAQSSALQLQMSRAQAGMALAPIQNVVSPSGVVVPYNAATQQPISAASFPSLYPKQSMFGNLPSWLPLAGLGALALILIVRGR